MRGRRLPTEGDVTFSVPEEPGDYSGPVTGSDGRPAVFFLLPIARDADVPAHARAVHSVTSPPHTFTEEPDGTLTITASILSRAPDGSEVWHGFLERGVWRPA